MDIYARMNDTLNMAHAQRRAEAVHGKLVQLEEDLLAAKQAMAWIECLCWWLHNCRVQWWNSANENALDMERARTGRAWDRYGICVKDSYREFEWSKLLP